MFTEADELNQASTGEKTSKLGSGVYVDVENLQGAAQEIIKALLENWPEVAPKPSQLNLYVPADQVELWRMWAESHFPCVAVCPRGVQHFSNSQTKNSADIAMAIDAISDILLETIGHIVVVSDDSDFIALYARVRAERDKLKYAPGQVPFLWVLTDRPKTRSSTINDYFPNNHIYVVPVSKAASSLVDANKSNTYQEEAPPRQGEEEVLENIAQAIAEQIPVGRFKSTDCLEIIRREWPNHQLARLSGQAFGVEFRKQLLPILEPMGVIEPNPGRNPCRYEITEECKNSTTPTP